MPLPKIQLPDFIVTWTSPSKVAIKDWRLGICAWILKILILIFVLVQTIANKQYQLYDEPTGFPTLWFEGNGYQNTWNESHAYCDNPAYRYKYPGESQSYWDEQPSCTGVDYGAMVMVAGDSAFALTYMKTEHRLNKPCLGQRDACAFIGHTSASGHLLTNTVRTNYEGDQICSCGYLQDRFAVGVDHMKLAVQHAFSTSSVMDYIKGSSTSRSAVTDDERLIKTCVLKPRHTDIDECNLPDNMLGYDLWDVCCIRTFDAGEPMALTIGEWLKASGTTLDERSKGSRVENDRETGLKPFRRITGLKLVYYMRYYGDKTDEFIRCMIEVQHRDGWTSAGSEMTYKSFNGFGDTEYYDSYRRGIRFQFLAHGRISVTDFQVLFNTLISGLVLLGFVNNVVSFLATMVVTEKAVYQKAITTELRYGRALAQFGMQAALACEVFKIWNTDGRQNGVATISQEELGAVYEPHLGEEVSEKVARTVIEQARGKDGVGDISCKDLIDLLGNRLLNLEQLERYAGVPKAEEACPWAEKPPEPQKLVVKVAPEEAGSPAPPDAGDKLTPLAS